MKLPDSPPTIRTGSATAQSPLRLALARVARTPSAWIGAGLVGIMLLGALTATWIAPSSPSTIDLGAQLQPPSLRHPLGTDFYGRDQVSRMLHGGRATLGIALGLN